MPHSPKVVIVLPAYNAASTLEATLGDLPEGAADEIVLVDDFSQDATVEKARELGIRHIFRHERNRGYGGNQKTCYQKALELEADIVVMLHPDYQYSPKLIPAMTSMIVQGVYPVVIGSRILGKGALRGGMPVYKYLANRMLTLIQNILMGQKLSEYHTGFRAFDASMLRELPLDRNSDDFIFDNQMLAQIMFRGHEVAEITCPTRYQLDSSSINFWRSLRYGLGVLRVSIEYRLAKWGLLKASYL